MTKQSRRLFFALSVLAMPTTGAIAQGTASPATTNFQSATSASTPADKTPASAAAGASKTTAPGAMGTTPGSGNMVPGDQPGRTETKTGGMSSTGSGR